MLSGWSIPIISGTPKDTRPVVAVSRTQSANGVLHRDEIRVKYRVPEEYRTQMEQRKLWIGCYKIQDGQPSLTVALPEYRCCEMDGGVKMSTKVLEPDAEYVFCLKEGEVWPLITLHCTTERVLIKPRPPEMSDNQGEDDIDLNSHMTRMSRPIEEVEAEERAKKAEERAAKLLARTRAATSGAQPANEPSRPPPPKSSAGGYVSPRARGGTDSTSTSPRSIKPLATGSVPSSSPGNVSPRGPPISAGGQRSPRSVSARTPPSDQGGSISPRRAGAAPASGGRSPPSKPAVAPPPPGAIKSSTKKRIPEKLIVKMLTELSIRTRQWEGEEVHLSFTGVSMTSWLQQTMKCPTRDEALRWALAMQEQGVFYGVDPENEPIEDSSRPYIINLAHEVVSVEWPRICEEEGSGDPPPPTGAAPRPPPMLRRHTSKSK